MRSGHSYIQDIISIQIPGHCNHSHFSLENHKLIQLCSRINEQTIQTKHFISSAFIITDGLRLRHISKTARKSMGEQKANDYCRFDRLDRLLVKVPSFCGEDVPKVFVQSVVVFISNPTNTKAILAHELLERMEVRSEGTNLSFGPVDDSDEMAIVGINHDIAHTEIFVKKDHGQ